MPPLKSFCMWRARHCAVLLAVANSRVRNVPPRHVSGHIAAYIYSCDKLPSRECRGRDCVMRAEICNGDESATVAWRFLQSRKDTRGIRFRRAFLQCCARVVAGVPIIRVLPIAFVTPRPCGPTIPGWPRGCAAWFPARSESRTRPRARSSRRRSSKQSRG